MKVSILGAGGMAEEALTWILQEGHEIGYLYDSTTDNSKVVIRREKQYIISNQFNPEDEYIIAVGYPETKRKIIESIKQEIKFAFPVRHRSCAIGENVLIGLGSIIYPLVTISTNVTIGGLATINSSVVIGHGCDIGRMFHASAGAIISGNVLIGDRVFVGANATLIDKIKICDDVIIGAGAVVTKDITIPGKYAGNPARRLSD